MSVRLRLLLVPVLLLVVVLVLAACSGSPQPATAHGPSASPSATGSTTPSAAASTTPSVVVTPARAVPRPAVGACHRLSYPAAVAPTDPARATPCRRPHTSVTFAVGSLDALGAVVDGHLLAVDSDRVQQRLAATCPTRLAGYVGGTAEDLRTSMLRAIWFSPSVTAADAGADGYRCDVVVLAAEDRLARLPAGADLSGALTAADWRDRYGMCGTADPARADFRRVVCAAPHRWQAITSTDAVAADGSPLAADAAYPGERRLTDAGTQACEAPARARSTDPLSVTWSYEPPTRAQWRAGQHYGLCWVPSA